MIFRQKFTNPWIIIVSESVHKSIFIPVYQAIRDHTIHHAVHLNVVRNRFGHGEKCSILFRHLGELVFHLSKVSQVSKQDVRDFFSKKGTNDRIAEVVVSDDKLFIMEFDAKKIKLTIKLHYQVKNKYDIICSH